MFSASWRRPESAEWPQVWRRFERTLKDGTVMKMRVQDPTEDMFDDVIDFMSKYYAPDEPWNYSTGISDDPVSMEVFRVHLKTVGLPQRAGLVCLPDEDDVKDADGKYKIIAANLTGVCCKKDGEDFSEFLVSKPIIDILTMYQALKAKHEDPYEKYKVDEYLNALGLCVHPDYRGYGISVDVLMSRIPLCKAIGVPLTMTTFTSPASQKSALKAGFQPEGSITYEELSEITGITFKKNGKETIVMSMLIK